MNFDAKIKHVCKLEGINQREFSEITEIPYSSIKKYTNGLMNPSVNAINKIVTKERFKKYKNFFFATDETSEQKELFMTLFDRVEKAGKKEEALAYLRFLSGDKDD